VSRPADDVESRAASKLKLARELERAKRTEGAVRRYREIVQEFPSTLAAEEARGLLGGKE
jgi:TolA-binding protein